MPRLIALTLLACSGGLQPRRTHVNRIRRHVQDETWIAEEDRAQPSYLDTLTKKMADSLLANSLEIQVPGPGAAREGDFFESQRRERAAPAALRINADLLHWRAKKEERRGRIKEARRLWQLCLQIRPDDGRTYIALARDLERRQRDGEAALQLLNEGLTQDPSNAYVRQAYAVLLERRGRTTEALKQLRLATAYDPKHVASWVATARLLTSDLRGAPLTSKEGCQSNRGRRRGLVARYDDPDARTSSREGRPAQRRRRHRVLQESTTGGAAELLRFIVFRRSRSSTRTCGRGKGSLQAVVGRQSVQCRYAGGLGESGGSAGLGLVRARELYDKAHRSHATNTRVFTAWAMAEARHGNATGALKLLERATRARGFAPGGITDAAVFSTLGEVCWHHLEDFDRAADAFRRSVETDRRHAAGYYKWATMELRRGRAGRARDLLQRGIWGCAGVAKSVEMAKLHRAKGQLEANSTLRGKRRWEKYEDGDMEKAQRWEQDAESARTSFRKALELSAAAATFAAWARFEEALGDVDAARDVLEDGLSVPRRRISGASSSSSRAGIEGKTRPRRLEGGRGRRWAGKTSPSVAFIFSGGHPSPAPVSYKPLAFF